MGKIAITDGMSENAISKLIDMGHEIIVEHFEKTDLENGILSEFDAVIVRSATKITKKVLDSLNPELNNLKFIGRAGVGVDNIDIENATNLGIYVCNTPKASTQSVVELTLGHLLSSVRYLPRADRHLRDGIWSKKELKGTELSGKKLGLVGFGRISKGVADISHNLGMDVHYYDPFVKENNQFTSHNSIEELFDECTHISIHCNLTDETKGLVNLDLIRRMPRYDRYGLECGNHIVNCARGGIINEEDALFALNDGSLSSLGLDVFEIEPSIGQELIQHENFHGTPHIAASTIEAQNRIGIEMVELIDEFFKGVKPSTTLN